MGLPAESKAGLLSKDEFKTKRTDLPSLRPDSQDEFEKNKNSPEESEMTLAHLVSLSPDSIRTSLKLQELT
jgi:hypothetical protein